MELVFQEEVCFLLTGTRVIHGINNTKERETHGRTRQSMMIDSLTSASLLSSVIIISRLKAARDKGGVSLKKNVHVIIIFFFFFSSANNNSRSVLIRIIYIFVLRLTAFKIDSLFQDRKEWSGWTCDRYIRVFLLFFFKYIDEYQPNI